MLDVESQIEKWIGETKLSEESKGILKTESLKRYTDLVNKLQIPPEELVKDVLHVTCDEHSCAVIRNLPKADMGYLAEVRRKTGIMQPEPLEKVDAMVKLLIANSKYSSTKASEVSEKAKHILRDYKTRCINDYTRGSPSITTAAAVKIAGVLVGSLFKEVDFEKNLGIHAASLYKKLDDIAYKLNLCDEVYHSFRG